MKASGCYQGTNIELRTHIISNGLTQSGPFKCTAWNRRQENLNQAVAYSNVISEQKQCVDLQNGIFIDTKSNSRLICK